MLTVSEQSRATIIWFPLMAVWFVFSCCYKHRDQKQLAFKPVCWSQFLDWGFSFHVDKTNPYGIIEGRALNKLYLLVDLNIANCG